MIRFSRLGLGFTHTFIAGAPESPTTSAKHESGPLIPQWIRIECRFRRKQRVRGREIERKREIKRGIGIT
jgi:hypothetical protein